MIKRRQFNPQRIAVAGVFILLLACTLAGLTIWQTAPRPGSEDLEQA